MDLHLTMCVLCVLRTSITHYIVVVVVVDVDGVKLSSFLSFNEHTLWMWAREKERLRRNLDLVRRYRLNNLKAMLFSNTANTMLVGLLF